ncbi:hypothetical protein SLA2020_261830 [Shorea laevis]
MVSKDLVPASFLKPFSQFPSSDSTSLGASLNNFSSSSSGPLWEANPTSDEGKEPLCLLWLGWCSIVMEEKDSLRKTLLLARIFSSWRKPRCVLP